MGSVGAAGRRKLRHCWGEHRLAERGVKPPAEETGQRSGVEVLQAPQPRPPHDEGGYCSDGITLAYKIGDFNFLHVLLNFE